MDVDSRQLVAQWAYDTHAVLARFHLWLEGVEVERAQPDEVSSRAFTPRGITRSLAMTAAATALGTRLFGHFGEGCIHVRIDFDLGIDAIQQGTR